MKFYAHPFGFIDKLICRSFWGDLYTRLPRWLSCKESDINAGDTRDIGSIPGLGRSPGAVDGKPLQYSCLENSMGRGAWQSTIHGGHKESATTEYAHAQASLLLRINTKGNSSLDKARSSC